MPQTQYKKGVAHAGGVLPSDQMASGRFADMARQKRRQAQIDKQTAGRQAGAKQTGVIGQYAQDKAPNERNKHGCCCRSNRNVLININSRRTVNGPGKM